jgi:hypothetical protein
MENVNKDVKEYTRVKKNGVVICSFLSFIDLKEIIFILKKRSIKGKMEVEYIMRYRAEFVTYALFFYHDYVRVGMVFPYLNYRNNN